MDHVRCLHPQHQGAQPVSSDRATSRRGGGPAAMGVQRPLEVGAPRPRLRLQGLLSASPAHFCAEAPGRAPESSRVRNQETVHVILGVPPPPSTVLLGVPSAAGDTDHRRGTVPAAAMPRGQWACSVRSHSRKALWGGTGLASWRVRRLERLAPERLGWQETHLASLGLSFLKSEAFLEFSCDVAMRS